MKAFLTMTAAALMTLGLGNLRAEAHGCPLTAQVETWYRHYLHRATDASGLNTWVSALRCGNNPNDVLANILASEEYFCRHGHTAEGFVAGLYADVLGRTACEHEIHEWVHRLRRIGCRRTLALEFLAAARPEFARHSVAIPVAVRSPVTHVHVERPRAVLVAVPAVVPVRVPVVPVRPVLPSSGFRVDFTYRSR